MALNYTQRPLFPPRVPEDNLVSPMNADGYFFEGNHENYWGAYSYGRSRNMRQGKTESWILGSAWNRVEDCGSPDSNSKDVVDLLPADPFGMDMHIKTTVTAITGLLEDLHGDYEHYIKSSINGNQDDLGLFFPWNLIRNSSLKAQPEVGIGMKLFPSYHVNEELESLNAPSKMARHVERDFEGALGRRDFKLTQASNVGYMMGSSSGINRCSAAVQMRVGEVGNCTKSFPSYHIREEFESHCFMNNNSQSAENLSASSKMAQHMEREMEGAFDDHDFSFTKSCNVGDIVGSSNGISSCSAAVKAQIGEVHGAADFEAEPHEGLVFALKYLGLKDLLSMEKVCKSLCSRVRGDAFLWCSIHVDQPLNETITDDALVELASRAQGYLQCLSLVECLKITVDGLRRVLETNPRLTKLCVPGCTRLSVEGVLDVVRAHNSREGVVGIRLVRIGGLNVVKPEHLEEMKSLLVGGGKANPQSPRRPHYHRWESVYLPCDDARAIDVEECPRCEKIRMVYDCPVEGCRAKDGATAPPCRACKMCIPRCDQCGTCIDERFFEETFCLDVLCADCFSPPARYHPGQDEGQAEPQGQQVSVEE